MSDKRVARTSSLLYRRASSLQTLGLHGSLDWLTDTFNRTLPMGASRIFGNDLRQALVVAPISNLLYRRFPIGKPPGETNGQYSGKRSGCVNVCRLEALRYSRLEI